MAPALRRYLGVSIVANLVWEILQLPLYTIWTTGTRKQQAFAVVHCTVGDAMIAGLSLLAALALFARRRGRALVLLASMRRAWRSVSATHLQRMAEHWRARELGLLGLDAGRARDRDGSGAAIAMVRGSDPRAVDRGRPSALDRSGMSQRLNTRKEEDTCHSSKLSGLTAGLITCLVAAALGIDLLVFHRRMLRSSCPTLLCWPVR